MNFNNFKQFSIKRVRIPISLRNINSIVVNKQECINFSTNDYLGISQDNEIKETFSKASKKYGLGACSSVFISGYFEIQEKLEESFAKFLNRDKVILFNSGYLANIGTISSIANRHHTILSDRLCHVSIIDGIRLSYSKHLRFNHNDMIHLKQTISQIENSIVISESIFRKVFFIIIKHHASLSIYHYITLLSIFM